MTEHTVIKTSIRMDNEDSISITSTQESEADEERSYIVDRILAEQDDDEGNKYYLIRWDGYGLLASTWEPAENIEGQATLDGWANEKIRVTRGLSKEFDVTAFEEELEKLRLAKEDRRERRKAKRERLGLVSSFSESEEEVPLSTLQKEVREHSAEAETMKNDIEEPVKRPVRKPGLKTKSVISKDESDTDDESLKNAITARTKRRTTSLPSQDHTTDTSEDSYVEELKQEANKPKTRDTGPRGPTRRRAGDVSGLSILNC
jgi:chromo domain-containing protein 1